MISTGAFAIIVVLAVVAFLAERKNMKASAAAAVWHASAKTERELRAAIRDGIGVIIADVKAWYARTNEGTDSVIAQIEARVRQIL